MWRPALLGVLLCAALGCEDTVHCTDANCPPGAVDVTAQPDPHREQPALANEWSRATAPK